MPVIRSTGTFQVTYVLPDALSFSHVRGEILATLQKFARLMLRDFQTTTQSWAPLDRGNSPTVEWESEVRFRGGEATALVFTDNEIWGHLNRGTNERWAVMSEDWQSKTSRGRLGSGSGRGRVVVRGKRFMQARNIQARPGIAARNWTILVRRKYEAQFNKEMSLAVQRGLRNALKAAKSRKGII